MALEAIGNAMSVQATSYQAPNKVAAPKVEPVDVDFQSKDAVAKIDDTTLVVESISQKEGTEYDGNAQEQSGNTERLRKAVEQLNKSNMANSEAVYGIHEGTNRVTIKIVDKDTKKVIKELPPEKTLDMIAKVWEMAGILVDEKR